MNTTTYKVPKVPMVRIFVDGENISPNIDLESINRFFRGACKFYIYHDWNWYKAKVNYYSPALCWMRKIGDGSDKYVKCSFTPTTIFERNGEDDLDHQIIIDILGMQVDDGCGSTFCILSNDKIYSQHASMLKVYDDTKIIGIHTHNNPSFKLYDEFFLYKFKTRYMRNRIYT